MFIQMLILLKSILLGSVSGRCEAFLFTDSTNTAASTVALSVSISRSLRRHDEFAGNFGVVGCEF